MKRTTTSRRGWMGALLAGGSALAIASSAFAGGFALREQSTVFQGTSFAGDGAGGTLSSMFWNSAAVAFVTGGIVTESSYSIIFPDSQITTQPGSTLFGILPSDSDNIGKIAILPSSYAAVRLDEKLSFGLAINSPFGLVTEPSNRFWAGQTFARTSDIKTYNVNPVLAYKLTPQLGIGVGLQIEYITGRLKQASGITPNSLNALIDAHDWGVGWTAGMLWTPTSTTSIGLGYRSQIKHDLSGTISIPNSPVLPAAVGTHINANVTLPEMITASFRQGISPSWTLLGTVEWTRWSRLQQLDIVCDGAANVVFCPLGAGQLSRTLQFGWHDSWFFSLGAEHQWSPQTTLRFGLAYEISPIQNPNERSPRVPDSDRIWASIGASYKLTPSTTIDLAYTHIFLKDSTLDRIESGLRLVADVEGSVDILSLGLRTQLWAPAEPLK